MLATQQNLVNRRRVTGQGMTEYIIIVAMIALAAIVAVGAFGGVVQDSFVSMSAKLAGEAGQDVTTSGTVNGAATTLQDYQQ